MKLMEGKNIGDGQILQLMPDAGKKHVSGFVQPLRWILEPAGQLHDAFFVEYRSSDGKSKVETTRGNHRRMGEPEYVQVRMGQNYFSLVSADKSQY